MNETRKKEEECHVKYGSTVCRSERMLRETYARTRGDGPHSQCRVCGKEGDLQYDLQYHNA